MNIFQAELCQILTDVKNDMLPSVEFNFECTLAPKTEAAVMGNLAIMLVVL